MKIEGVNIDIANSDPIIKTGLERSHYLIAHPETSDYHLWHGGLIRKDSLIADHRLIK